MGFDTISVGDELQTAGRTVTEADLVNFAGVSGDFNHLHLNAARMAASDYGERIAHGALVFSMLTGLVWQAREDDDDLVAFYGVDRLRWRAPTFVGDTLHAELEVTAKEPRDHPDATGVVRYDATMTREDGTAVLSCEMLALMR